ncbi:MAG TPA: 50S ribosomal protein L35 [Candidatus Paceibacterota bacterium]|nr:50S ribosomal protein L35 [Candidatus Paceibacterota bacterium]
MKTNKSFTKRLKITKNGKVVARKPGKNHFNAKESRSNQMAGNRTQAFVMTAKVSQRFIKTASPSKN